MNHMNIYMRTTRLRQSLYASKKDLQTSLTLPVFLLIWKSSMHLSEAADSCVK